MESVDQKDTKINDVRVEMEENIDENDRPTVVDMRRKIIQIPFSPFELCWKANAIRSTFWRSALRFLICWTIVWTGVICNAFTSVLVLEKHLDPDEWPSLPDIVLDKVSKNEFFTRVNEHSMQLLAVITLFHVFCGTRPIRILSRYCIVVGYSYVIRSILIYVTSIPVPNTDFARERCHKQNLTIFECFILALKFVFIYGGWTTSGVALCGDLIMSGHTLILTSLVYHNILYAPKYKYVIYAKIVVVIAFCISLSSILISHNHYTIDVLISFFITFLMCEYLTTHTYILQNWKNSQTISEKETIVKPPSTTNINNSSIINNQQKKRRGLLKLPLVPFFKFIEEQGYFEDQLFLTYPWKNLPFCFRRKTENFFA